VGILSALGSLGSGSGQHASVLQALLQQASSQPNGLAGLLDNFRQNGMGQHVDSWMGPQQNQGITPQQAEQGVGKPAVQAVSQKTGLGEDAVKATIAAALPVLISHLAHGSGQLPSQAASGGGLAGIAENLLSRAV
jgi:uncharacterized protein YidB (DUF937 family)